MCAASGQRMHTGWRRTSGLEQIHGWGACPRPKRTKMLGGSGWEASHAGARALFDSQAAVSPSISVPATGSRPTMIPLCQLTSAP